MSITVSQRLMFLTQAKKFAELTKSNLSLAQQLFIQFDIIGGIINLVKSLGQHQLSEQYLQLAIEDYSNVVDIINGLLGRNLNVANLTDEQLVAILEKLLIELQQKETLEAKFQAIRTALQADVNADITQLLTDYQTEIESLFDVSLTNSTGLAWSLSAIHFARQGLEATAEAFERWAEDYIEQNSLQFVVNRYELYRRIMGHMTFDNVGEVKINVANAEMSTIKVNQRPKFISYWVFESELGTQYAPFVDFNGTVNDEPEGYTTAEESERDIQSLPQYTDNTYLPNNVNRSEIVPSNPLRQAFMTPNNFIHELGHSFSRFSGLGFMLMGSMEQTLSDASSPPDSSRNGLGNPRSPALYYEHAQVKDDDSDGIAEFVQLSGTDDYDEQLYLLYDLFEQVYNLWTSSYYPYPNTNTRVDVFAHNYSQTDVETVADGFLNWIRDSFDNNDTNGTAWIQFITTNAGLFIHNTLAWQLKPVVYYFAHGDIPATPVMYGTVNIGTYGVRLYPSSPTPDTTRIGSVSDKLDSSIPIYGWWSGATGDSASAYWLLVADSQLRLVWVAENGITHNDNLLNTTNEIQPEMVSPIRSLDLNDFLIITGQLQT